VSFESQLAPSGDGRHFANRKRKEIMRAETQNIVDEIRQAITLLRRHL
jgi:hypothetical protein